MTTVAREFGGCGMEDVLGALGGAFCGKDVTGGPPRDEKLAAAAVLAGEKYANDEWTFRR